MYVNSAYWHNKILDFKDKSKPLFVCSCGTYHLFTRPKLPTYRPRGRLDYQIIYVASGKAHFYFNGVEHIISAGNMVIYRPKEEQRYYYYAADHTQVYWVHFTGGNVKNILRKYGIADHMRVLYTGTSLEYKQLFEQMIHELTLCKDDYEELLVGYLQHLLILIHRSINNKPREKTLLLVSSMDNAVRYFHENYNKQICIEEYAAKQHISVSWFIRNFKEYTDVTPTQYLLSLRISNAQTLLETTNYNVTEISEIVGYNNPLYFSRLFKKQVGMSPSDFRKHLSEHSN
ncbi:MAG: helix-turn-helix transcriptional regulator [Lachnospiraceae bacterium]|nr:helix-turn-helix transcriptional regulator [Lachnospiraceae bacterium]